MFLNLIFFLILLKQFFLKIFFKYEQNYIVLLKLTAKFVLQIRVIYIIPKN